MLVCALDPAVKTGWSFGPSSAKSKPVYGAIRVKAPDEAFMTAPRNIGFFLRDMFEGRLTKLESFPSTIPDLLAYEAPLNPHVWFDMCRRIGRPQNAESLSMQHAMAGAIEEICGEYGVRTEQVNRQQVLRFFTGSRSHGDGKGDPKAREKAKKAVIATAQLLGLMPDNLKDDDIADSLAIHQYASATWGRSVPLELHLHGEAAR